MRTVLLLLIVFCAACKSKTSEEKLSGADSVRMLNISEKDFPDVMLTEDQNYIVSTTDIIYMVIKGNRRQFHTGNDFENYIKYNADTLKNLKFVVIQFTGVTTKDVFYVAKTLRESGILNYETFSTETGLKVPPAVVVQVPPVTMKREDLSDPSILLISIPASGAIEVSFTGETKKINTEASLLNFLKQHHSAINENKIFIKKQSNSPFKDFKLVKAAMQKAGFSRFRLVTDPY